MRGSDGTLMCSQQPSFHQGSHPVGQRQKIVADGGFPSDNLMRISLSLQAVVSQPIVRTNHTAGSDHFFNSRFQTVGRGIVDSAQSDPADSLSVLLSGHQNQDLPLRSAAALSWPLAAHIGLVDFYRALQAVPPGTHHGPAKFMQPHPRRPIAAQPQGLAQSYGANSILLVRHVPHRLKPKPQGFASILKERPRRDRSFEVALRTTKQQTSHPPGPVVSASRASKSFGPPQTEHIVPARVLRGKPILKFLGSFRILLHKGRILQIVATGVKCIPPLVKLKQGQDGQSGMSLESQSKGICLMSD